MQSNQRPVSEYASVVLSLLILAAFLHLWFTA